MKVLLSTTLNWKGYWYHSGDIADLPDDVAEKYIAAGSAERMASEPQIEAATLGHNRHENMMRTHKPQLRRR